MEEIPVKYTWYRFIELKDQKWVEFELGKMSSRDLILQSFSLNFQNQAPWGEDELKDMSEEGEMRKAIREAWLYKNSNKKAVNDKYIELLQMGWFTSNTTIRFRLDHNLSIDAFLEDPNLSYSLEKFDADLIRDKIQSTDTVIIEWLRGHIPEQATLEVIKQIILESKEFKRLEVNQVQLLIQRIILKPGKK